jgi:hypothetical protein
MSSWIAPTGFASGTVPDARGAARATWINGRGWDLGWLIGSAVVVPLGLVAVALGASSDLVNIGVTALVGGPHLFATFLTTYLDPQFRRKHGAALVAVSILVPAFVVALTFANFQALLSFFIFAASLHVLQQNAYLADVYRRRAGRAEPAWSRWADYGILFVSFYPIASYKLVRDDFTLGSVTILMPPFTKTDFTWRAITAAFVVLLTVWLWKTAGEFRRGVMNTPKTVLIGVTVVVAFLVPAAARGERLELAFQAVNAWHSIQYLAIVWVALELRRRWGMQRSGFVAALGGSRGSAALFYGLLFAATVGLLAVVSGLIRWDPLGLSRMQYYYMAILSVLLVHYALDAYLFFAASRDDARPDEIPMAGPAVA